MRATSRACPSWPPRWPRLCLPFQRLELPVFRRLESAFLSGRGSNQRELYVGLGQDSSRTRGNVTASWVGWVVTHPTVLQLSEIEGRTLTNSQGSAIKLFMSRWQREGKH